MQVNTKRDKRGVRSYEDQMFKISRKEKRGKEGVDMNPS